MTIWLVHVAAMVSPGPNFLLVSQLAASDRGRSAGFAALGVTLGALVWVTAAVLGINAVFKLFPGLRLVLQLIGGMYLLYVAVRLWRSNGPDLKRVVTRVPNAAAFRLGLLTNITNPKSALFFGSVFAACFPPAPSSLLQLCVVVMIVANALCWHMLLAWMFSRPRVRAAYARVRTTANRVASAAVGALGLGLLVATVRQARA